MKKRVSESEIELAKRSSRILFLISFILLVLLFVGFCLVYVLDIDIYSYVPFTKSDESKSCVKRIIKKGVIVDPELVTIDVDIRDYNVQSFYETVKITNRDVCMSGGYIEKKHVDVSNLSQQCKFSIASKIYEKDIENGLDGKLIVKEKYVKKAYEGLFGTGSYEKQESIPCLYKTNFIYRDDYYFTDSIAFEDDAPLKSYEKIIEAKRNDNRLNITSAVVYYEPVLSLLCKDSRCENSIEAANPSTEYGNDYLSLYVDYHKDHLYQYTYHFEMDKAGFYRYVGYDRTNE